MEISSAETKKVWLSLLTHFPWLTSIKVNLNSVDLLEYMHFPGCKFAQGQRSCSSRMLHDLMVPSHLLMASVLLHTCFFFWKCSWAFILEEAKNAFLYLSASLKLTGWCRCFNFVEQQCKGTEFNSVTLIRIPKGPRAQLTSRKKPSCITWDTPKQQIY